MILGATVEVRREAWVVVVGGTKVGWICLMAFSLVEGVEGVSVKEVLLLESDF